MEAEPEPLNPQEEQDALEDGSGSAEQGRKGTGLSVREEGGDSREETGQSPLEGHTGEQGHPGMSATEGDPEQDRDQGKNGRIRVTFLGRSSGHH